jgi:hypothetical protein
MGARRRITCSFCLLPFALCLLGLTGCRNCDLLEAELRTRERELADAHAEVARLEAYTQTLQHELGGLHGGVGPIPPELASQTCPVRRICLATGTGGQDEDRVPGDEALRVVVEPLDPDNHPLKTPGSLHVEALEITPEGLKIPLSCWDFGPEQLRARWQCGLCSTGYTLVLPWKKWPSSDRLRVVARFCLADGRQFETDRDIPIRLPPTGCRPVPPGPPPGPGLPLPRPEPTLPMPRPLTPRDDGPEQDRASTFAEEAAVQPAACWRRHGPQDRQPVQSKSAAFAEETKVAPAAGWHRHEAPSLDKAVRLLTPVPLKPEDWLPQP